MPVCFVVHPTSTEKMQRLLSTFHRPKLTVLGIESSCDDSCVGIVEYFQRKVLVDERHSQFDIHKDHGGIVPTLAVRAHETNLPIVLNRALEALPQGETVDLVAVTQGPGLKPCLRVGMTQARALSQRLQVPLVRVHHLVAHTRVSQLHDPQDEAFLSLLVSGGHTVLSLVEGASKQTELGSTMDDAMGEAFDKVARALPIRAEQTKHGGALLEDFAKSGQPQKGLRLPEPLVGPNYPKASRGLEFSFSGLKSATARELEAHRFDPKDIALEFQRVATAHCMSNVQRALTRFPHINRLVVCGGVASNSYVRESLQALCNERNCHLVLPPKNLCVDNGVMIAFAGAELWNHFSERSKLLLRPDDLPRPRWPLSALSQDDYI